MNTFRITLQMLGVGIFGAALVHVVLGSGGEVLLGSNISASSITDPALDSQNRFYGAAFGLFGGVFLLASKNITKYHDLLLLAFATFFIAGLARLISVAAVGWPPVPILTLTGIELAIPPLMWLWLRKVST